ncbi:MAG: UbiA family prenyltransferase, partial [bacterium]
MRDLLSLLRPAQWVKNLFLFAPILFDKSLADPRALLRTVAGFAAFCVLASAVYVLNAILDRASDAAHPTKRHRPLPAGRVGVPTARGVLVVTLVLALGGSALLGPLFLSAALGYLVINVG